MSRSRFLTTSTFLSSLLALSSAQDSSSAATTASGFSTTLNGTPTSFRSIFTIPAEADIGQPVQPNVLDPTAVNAQDVCPGYTASDLQQTDRNLTATLTLAGSPCNVYGIDIEQLKLSVEYQAKGRIAVSIVPSNLDASNQSQWIVPEALIPRPQPEDWQGQPDITFDCKFNHSSKSLQVEAD